MKKQIKTMLLHLPIDLSNPNSYDNVLQPYGLASISSYLKQQKHNVFLYDANAYHVDRDVILKKINDYKPDLLGLTVYTSQLPQTISFLRDVKAKFPNIVTVLGGPHPSSSEYENILIQNSEVDFVCQREGEYAMHELINAMENESGFSLIKGLAYREDSKVRLNEARPFIDDLDSLPMADWDSLPMGAYWGVSAEKKNFVNLVFSRGCKFNCIFCGQRVAMGRSVRKRSPDSIIDEIKFLYERHSVRELNLSDATFNVDNQWVREICDRIIKFDKSDFVWGCNLRADCMDRDTIRLMKRSGLTNIFIGVESGDDNILRSMKKGTNIDMIRNALKMLDEIGVKVYLGFLLGMPKETPETLAKTLEFAKELKKYSTAFSLATPFPGTELYEQAKREGFYVKDWKSFDYHGIAYVPKGLTREELSYFYNNTVKNYYLSIPFIFYQIIQIRSWLQFKKTIRLGWRILVGRRKRIKNLMISEI